MKTFKEWLTRLENFGGSAVSPSSAEDQGEGGDGMISRMDRPGAFPTYELPKKKKVRAKIQGTRT